MPRNATTTANGPFGSPSGNNKNSLNTKLAKGFLIILLWLGSLMATMFLANHETDSIRCDGDITRIMPVVPQLQPQSPPHATIDFNNNNNNNNNNGDAESSNGITPKYLESLLTQLLFNISSENNIENANNIADIDINVNNRSIDLIQLSNKLSKQLSEIQAAPQKMASSGTSQQGGNNNNNIDSNGGTTRRTSTGDHYRIPPIPSIIGIGPEKAGTTTLADLISFHPKLIDEFVKPQNEPSGVTWEMRMFMKCGGSDLDKTLNIVSREGSPAVGENPCSLGSYQRHWPIMYNDIRYKNILDANWKYLEYLDSKNDTGKSGLNEQTQHATLTRYYSKEYDKYIKNWKFYYYFEKSPAYWYHEHIAYIFGEFLVPQGTRFYIQVRDPVLRLFSYYNHQSSLGRIKKQASSFGSYMKHCYENVDNGITKTIISKLKDTSKPLFSKDSKHRAFMTDFALEIVDLWKQHVYSDFHAVYDKGKLGKHPKTGRLTGDDVSPWKGVGASCYIVPLLMWLKHIPIEHLTIVQSESIFGEQTQFIYDFRCWVANGYEFYGNVKENCPKYREKTDMGPKPQKLVSSSRGRKPTDGDSKWAKQNVFNVCNDRLKEFLNFQDNSKILLNGKFDWSKWG